MVCAKTSLVSLVVVVGVAGPAAAGWNLYDGYTSGVFLPFTNAPAGEGDLTVPPSLGISFGGSVHGVTMDTGSTGVVVSADMIPNLSGLPSQGAGTLTYSSSGRVMNGTWVVTAVTVHGAGGASVTTTPMAVLAVNQITCLEKARDCTPTTDPKGVAMMGIGFGRQSDHQAQSTPDRNPFLNLQGTARRGYIVTRTGVHVGLTPANTAGAFTYVKLARSTQWPDWLQAPVCLSVNGVQPPACGISLMDTGVSGMFLTVTPAQAPASVQTIVNGQPSLVNGTVVSATLPGQPKQAAYSITVGGSGNPLTPTYLDLVPDGASPFINTSLNFLNGFDYLYDADGGYVGYRWTGHAAADIGSTTPMLSLVGAVTLPDGFTTDLPVVTVGGTTLTVDGTAALSNGLTVTDGTLTLAAGTLRTKVRVAAGGDFVNNGTVIAPDVNNSP